MFLLKKLKKEALRQREAEGNKLPANAVVSHYAVCFKPFIEDLHFEASVVTYLTLVDNSKHIVMNAVELITTKLIWEEDGTKNRQEPSEMQLHAEKGQLLLHFDPFLIPQQGQLRMNFKGKINDKKMAGFFRSKCKVREHDYILVTNFPPTYARRCFPCWDEPSSKATFDISLVLPKGRTVVGNTLVKVAYPHKRDAGLEIVEFKKTPLMSAYSLAFVVGNFEHIEKRSDDDEIPIRVYTPPGKGEEGRYALNVACKIVPYLSEYFGHPFPLQKMDFVAIADSPLRQVEGWGLTIFQESHLLLKEGKKVSVNHKVYVSSLICKELCKQWIGNWVTFDCWSFMWMKEGLALFLRYFCMQEINPDFQASAEFVTGILQPSLRFDGYKSIQPVELDSVNVVDIDELFSELGLFKGASIFRMLYHYIGESAFKIGISTYIEKFKFQNASTEELWKCLEETSSKPVKLMMTAWTKYKNFPIVRVTSKQDGKNRFIKLSQEKFTMDMASLGRDTKLDPIYLIPITVTSGLRPKSIVFETMMDTRTTAFAIPDIGRHEWIKLNAGVVGFYRVKYPPEMLTGLVHAIRDRTMEPIDRLNILDDQFALMMSGMGSTIEILTLMEAFMEEDDLNVWQTINGIFEKLLKVFAYVSLDESVKHFGRYLYGRILEKLGLHAHQYDDEQTLVLRGIILQMMTAFQHQDTLDKCSAIYEMFLKGEGSLPPELRFVIYNVVVTKGDQDTVKGILKTFKDTDSIEEKEGLANALGSTTDAATMRYILEYSITDDMRKIDSILLLITLAKSKNGRDMVWNFFKENIFYFKPRYGPRMASKLVKGLIEDFASEDKAFEISDFMKANPFPGTERAVQQAVESIRLNEAWLKREKNIASLQDYLEADTL